MSPEVKSKVSIILQSAAQIFKLSSCTRSKPVEAHTSLEIKNYSLLIEHFAEVKLMQFKGSNIQMIHSFIYPLGTVVIEDAKVSLALIHSNYQIVGEIANPVTFNKWLNANYFSL